MKFLSLILLAGLGPFASAANKPVLYKANCLVYTEPTSATTGPAVLAQVSVELREDEGQVLFTDSNKRSYHVMAYYLGGNSKAPVVISLSIQDDTKPHPGNVIAEAIGPIEPGTSAQHGLTLIAPAINNMNCSPAP